MSGESRTGDEAADQPNGTTGGADLGLNLEASLPAPPHAAADTIAPPADEELRFLRRETEVVSDPQRLAALSHETGHILEHSVSDAAAAVVCYSRALSSDAGLASNLWALRRLAEQRGSWDEVVKLFDAEVSFVADLAPAERADLLVERGRVLEDRVGRDQEAAASYRSALAACPDHPAALLSMLMLAARTSDRSGQETALAGLARRSLDPIRRACFAVELARAQRSARDPAGEDRAFETLHDALAAVDGHPPRPLIRELARMSPVVGGASLRLRVLQELLNRAGDDTAATVALLREQARLLASSARDHAAAGHVLQHAIALLPSHPLLWREVAEAADLAAEPELLSKLAEARTLEPALASALALRRAEAMARVGHTEQALAILDSIEGVTQHDFQVWAARIRFLARAGDAAGLAAAFRLEAELARRGEHAHWIRIELDAESRGRHAADALVRAGAIGEHALHDQPVAEADYRAALACSPHHRSAVDALERILFTTGRWGELNDLLVSELDAEVRSPGHDADPTRAERRAYLLETVVALQRDRLSSPRTARERQAQLDELQGQDARSRVRTVDLDLRLLAEAEMGTGAGPAADDLLELQRQHPGRVAEAALQLEAARSAARAGDLTLAEDLAREAASLNPGGMGAAAVEAVQSDADRRLEVVTAELAAAESREDSEVIRALRFRIAFIEASEQRFAAAVDTLAPLRGAGDSLALAWSDHLARRSGDPDVLLSLLLETGDESDPDRLVALGEALEARGLPGDAATAAANFEEAMLSAPSTDAAIGLLRQRAAAADLSGVLVALRCAAEASQPELGQALRLEAELLKATCGQQEPAPSQTPAAADPEREVVAWLIAARSRRTTDLANAELAVAARLSDSPAPGGGTPRAAAIGRALARARLGSPAAALSAFERVHDVTTDPGAAGWLLTDLDDASAATPAVDELRLRRAEAVGGSMRTALLLELASSKEHQGRLKDAVAAYGRALANDSDCIPALEGLARLAAAAGNTAGEARALARLGEVLTQPLQRARLYDRAAQLYERCEHRDEAVALYWRTLQLDPLHANAFERVRELLSAAGDAAELDRLLGFRLAHVAQEHARVPLYWERARNRLDGLRNRRLAAQDLHRILAIAPHHSEAISLLARLCIEVGAHSRAAELLERYLQIETDSGLRNEAQLRLAGLYQTTGDLRSAVTTLSEAVEARPTDAQARERLAEVYQSMGEWRNALEVLRELERLTTAPRAAAEVKLRIALILRDQKDLSGALELLRVAAEMDPLGDAPRELLTVSEEVADTAAHDEAVSLALNGVRRLLHGDVLDATALHQLRAICKGAGLDDEANTTAQLLAVIGEAPAPSPVPPRSLQRPPAGSISAHLTHTGATGFISEIWPQICDAAWELGLAPVDRGVFSRASRLPSGPSAELGWLYAAAQALDVDELTLHVGSVGENDVIAIDSPAPALAVGAAIKRGDPVSRFKVGRALLLMRHRATLLDLMSADAIARLVAAAGVAAGAGQTADEPAATIELARELQRVLGRKEKKALTAEAERFRSAANPSDWQQAFLLTADRAGLLTCGDLGAAIRVTAGVNERLTAAVLRERRRAVDLIAWALSSDYSALRRDVGLVGS